MSYFQCEGTFSIGAEARISGEAVRHIRDARRVKAGEEIEVQDSTPTRFRATVRTVDRDSITLCPLEVLPLPQEPRYQVRLLQAFISEQKLDLILQKTTELGVSHIVIFQSENSPHAIPAERLRHKMERWQNILVSACEQSGRAEPPELALVDSLDAALLHTQGTLVLLSENDTAERKTGDATVVVGPEGGLSKNEIALLKGKGALEIALGPYTLRAETAAIVGVGVCTH